MARLLRAGVPATEALRTLVAAVRGDRGGLRQALLALLDRSAAGETLAGAMERFPGIFAATDVAVLRAAEQVGQPAQGFESISTRLEVALAVNQGLRAAVRLPLFLAAGSILTGPLPNLLLHPEASYLRQVRGPLIELLVVALVLLRGVPGLWRFFGASALAASLSRLFYPVLWRLPLLGGVYLSHLRGMFCRVLSRNLSHGLTPQQALDLAVATCADPVARARRDVIVQGVRAGRDLPTMLVKAGLADPDDLVLLCASERAGLLDVALMTAAERSAGRMRHGISRVRFLFNLALAAALLLVIGRGAWHMYQSTIQSMEQTLRNVVDGGTQASQIDTLLRMIEEWVPILTPNR